MIVMCLTENLASCFLIRCANECMFPKVAAAIAGIMKDVKEFHDVSSVGGNGIII